MPQFILGVYMKLSLWVAAITVSLSASVMAHHGFGRFDMTAEQQWSGTLTGIEFVNPHSYVQFDMVLDDGSIRNMGCEMRAATVLRRSGWSREMFVTGTHIEITGRPHRDDPTSCYVETIAIGDAPVLERYQQLEISSNADASSRPERLADGAPNISGDWAQEQYLLANLPDGSSAGLVPKSMVTAIESGEIPRSRAPDSGWGVRPVTLTVAGEAAAEILRNEPPEQHPRILCQITSILFDWVFDGPINRITQSMDAITLEYGRDLVRTVDMLGNSHPANPVPSRSGHSIGHWDGDVLVVDTTGFLPGRIAGNLPHSAQLHVMERFYLERDWQDRIVLHRDYVAEDPLYFVDSYAGSDIVLLSDAEFRIDECKELAFEYTTGAIENR
jgi:hypothetical protein